MVISLERNWCFCVECHVFSVSYHWRPLCKSFLQINQHCSKLLRHWNLCDCFWFYSQIPTKKKSNRVIPMGIKPQRNHLLMRNWTQRWHGDHWHYLGNFQTSGDNLNLFLCLWWSVAEMVCFLWDILPCFSVNFCFTDPIAWEFLWSEVKTIWCHPVFTLLLDRKTMLKILLALNRVIPMESKGSSSQENSFWFDSKPSHLLEVFH